jgi:hypothetical protein
MGYARPSSRSSSRAGCTGGKKRRTAKLCSSGVCVETSVDPVAAALGGFAALALGAPAAAAMAIGFAAGAIFDDE